LPIKLAVSYHKVDDTSGRYYGGYTLNASPGGLYLETPAGALGPGNLLQIELSILPTAGVLEFGGRMTGRARVLRTENVQTLNADAGSPLGSHHIALQFCQRPKLCM
jgi:hypothetical protein